MAKEKFRRLKMLAVLPMLALAASILSMPAVEAKTGIYSSAVKYTGLHERKHTRAIKGIVGVNPRSTPWCGFFVAAMVRKNGIKPVKGYGRAAAWRSFGKGVSLKNARKGDVVVIRTRRGNHVGIYKGRTKNKVLLIGGNQSNQVKVSAYSVRSIRAIRRAPGSTKFASRSIRKEARSFKRSSPGKSLRAAIKKARERFRDRRRSA